MSPLFVNLSHLSHLWYICVQVFFSCVTLTLCIQFVVLCSLLCMLNVHAGLKYSDNDMDGSHGVLNKY